MAGSSAIYLAALLSLASVGPVVAQSTAAPAVVQSQILTIDTERLFADSLFGKFTARDYESKGASLAAENRQIEAELTEEERLLTEKRATRGPAEFRLMADAFDAKVQAVRRTQELKTRDLTQDLEERRVIFLNAAAPVLEDIMKQSGAAVILEQRTVFLSATAIDITSSAIARIDAVLGEGPANKN